MITNHNGKEKAVMLFRVLMRLELTGGCSLFVGPYRVAGLYNVHVKRTK